MNRRPPSAAGGLLIAAGAMGGAAIGFLYGQATPGFLAGLAVGVVAAIIVWQVDSRRR